jgi:hypothetical protein
MLLSIANSDQCKAIAEDGRLPRPKRTAKAKQEAKKDTGEETS